MTRNDRLHAVVAGATGLVGGLVVQELIREPACDSITALVRTEPGLRDPKLHVRVVEYDKLDPAVIPEHANTLFCCLGTTIKKAGSQQAFRTVDFDYVVRLAELARERGIRHFLLVSSIGADSKSRVFYSRVKGQVEQAVRETGPPVISIFRPSLLLGERESKRPGEKAGELVLALVRFLLIGKWRKYRAIKATTVAHAMVHVARHHADDVSIFESDIIAKFGEE